MTPHDLLASFEVLAEAPNGIQRLRELVLELAVRGKLVEQDPGDEPARELLKRIKAQKARLVNEGALKRVKIPEPITPLDIPYDLPKGWVWARLTDVFLKITDGTHHSPPNGPSGDFLYITAKNIKSGGVLLAGATYVSEQVHREIFSRCNPEPGDILYIKDGATTGVVTVNDITKPFSLLSSVGLLKTPEGISSWFACYVMRSPFFFDQLREQMSGVGIPRVTISKLDGALLPVPPTAEQLRIVARVDELMALLDRLEAKRQGREVARAAAQDSALATLREAATPEDVEAAWLRVQDRFHDLFTTPEDIGPLRQTILQLAVRGVLACQRALDVSAQVVLDHIRDDKNRLIKSGKFRAEKVDFAIDPAECPMPLPESWRWCRMRQLVGMVTSGSRSWNAHYADEGASFIRSQDIKRDRLEYDDRAFVNPPEGAEGMRTRVEVGDLLVTITGANVGKCALIIEEPGEAFVSQHVALIKLVSKEIGPFLHRWLTSDFAGRGYLLGTSYGAKPGLNLDSIRNLLVPMPPPAERDRILATLGQMLAKCDALLDSINMSSELSSSFTSAVVHHLEI